MLIYVQMSRSKAKVSTMQVFFADFCTVVPKSVHKSASSMLVQIFLKCESGFVSVCVCLQLPITKKMDLRSQRFS